MPAVKLSLNNIKDVKKVLVVKYNFNVILAFWMFSPSLPDLLIFALQFL